MTPGAAQALTTRQQSGKRQPGGPQILGERGAVTVLTLCLAMLATNAVLIQTVVPDESVLKNVIRAAVIAVTVFTVFLSRGVIPVLTAVLCLVSVALLALSRNPDQFTYVFVFLLVAALLPLNERSVERAVLLGSVWSLALVFIFLRAGLTQNVVLDYRGRATYGTNGVPFFFNLVYGACVMLVYYTQKHRLRSRHLALLVTVVGATYFYLQTDARGGYLTFLGFVVLVVVIPFVARSGLVQLVIATLPALFLAGAFVIASQHQNDALNRLMSYRPRLLQAFLGDVGLVDVVLSRSVKQVAFAVDNSWLHLLVGGGLLLTAVFFILYGQAMRSLFAERRYAEIAFVVAACVYFNSESLLLRVENLFVVLFWFLLFRYARFTRDLEPMACRRRPARKPLVRSGGISATSSG
jgi:hypothetical protein